MDKKTIKLKPTSNIPFEIEPFEHETNALIRIVKEKHCKALSLVLTNEGGAVSKSLPAKLFNQLSLVGIKKFSVEANFISVADSFAELEIYMGSWEEMILTEAELSFSASPFYISCNNDQLEFTIGAPDDSRMEVKADGDKGFSVVTTLVHASEPGATMQAHITEGEGAQVIGRLYGRIKGRVNGNGFHERQEEYKEKYSENFNATLREGLPAVAGEDDPE